MQASSARDGVRVVDGPWLPDLPGSLEYPGIGRRVLRRRPAFTAFLLRRGVASPEAWQDGETSEHAAAFCGPAPARVSGQLHWQFVLRDIPALVTGRTGRWLTVLTLILAGARDPVTLSRRCCRVAGGMPMPDDRGDAVAWTAVRPGDQGRHSPASHPLCGPSTYAPRW